MGGFPSWHTTDPHPTNCEACAAPMVLLLTVDSREWDGANDSWMPTEEWDVAERLRDSRPTQLTIDRDGLPTPKPANRPPQPPEQTGLGPRRGERPIRRHPEAMAA
ncbi:hypothetical protein ACIA6D_36835 [Streptomyces cacaoi]